MSETKLTFKRYEKKYLLSREKYEALRAQLDSHIVPDEYFQSTVCSIYYDSDDYTLIRRSIEKPVYKEKLRLRSYNTPGPDGTVFVELKKKFKGLVYKRRITMTNSQAMAYLSGEAPAPVESQMTHELDWFLHENRVKPKVLIACDRTAYVDKENSELRFTFDENMRFRQTELDLTAGSHGELIIEPGMVLMELKIPGAAPVWLARMLSELEIFATGFSKYGTCYTNYILDEYFNGVFCCV